MTGTVRISEQIDPNWLPHTRIGACAAVFIEIEDENGLCMLHFSGRFATGADLEYLSGKLDRIRSLRSTRVLADFTRLVSIGSTGVSFIVSLYRIVTQESGGRLVLAGATPLVREALDITGVSKIILLAKNVDSGLAELRDRNASATSS